MIGPAIEFSVNNYDTEGVVANGSGISYTRKFQNEHLQFGLNAGVGVEWFYLKYMSLHAEYGLNLAYFFDTYNV